MRYTIFNTDDDFKLHWSQSFTDISQFRDPLNFDRKKLMQEYDFTIQLDTRAAVINFVDIASRATGDVDLWNIGRQRVVDGKSLLGVMTLDLSQPLQVKIHTTDPDEYMQFCNSVKKFSI